MNEVIPYLREYTIIKLFPYNVNVSLYFCVSRVHGTCFLTAVSDERNGIGAGSLQDEIYQHTIHRYMNI